jgi:UDP-N-acetylmuramate--L-alanine ligase/UDP-N-acetylenolpyruvoylglucosamine reductase
MAGLAVLLRDRGLAVSGCDLARNSLAPWLERQGIRVLRGHGPEHLESGTGWLIRSSAVPDDAPELAAARARGIPVSRRGEVLAALLDGRASVAVGGTHGKTTTTGFIAQILAAAGRAPAFCIGGEVSALGGVAGTGAGAAMVVEADESDGTLALYAPDIAVITNIEFDHMEHFAGVEAFEACFARFAANARRQVIYCADDPRAARVCGGCPNGVSYGAGPGAAVRAEAITLLPGESRYTLVRGGVAFGEVRLPVPGRHNVLNSLAAAATGLALGLAFEQIREALGRVELPRRRFERVVDRPDVTVISDYAHHPSEVAAVVRVAAGLGRRRTLAVFQPHRYTRTLALGAEFPAAFAGVDELVLAPVYAASEKPLPGGTIEDLYAHFRAAGVPAAVRLAASLPQAWGYLRTRLARGDLLLVVGAGDVERIAGWARDALGERPLEAVNPAPGWRGEVEALGLEHTLVRWDEPLGPRTTFGVGGSADLWLEIGSEQDLAAVYRWAFERGVPRRVFGGGSNVLASDLGVRGAVLRLAGAEFRRLDFADGIVRVGAAVPLARLTAWAAEKGLAGLEFLHGIPGTAGGAVRGNAGAWGHAIGERVAWLRVLASAGLKTLDASALDFGYRSCPALHWFPVLEAGLRVEPGARATIEAAMAAGDERRAWMRGLRCAGSVFKNPPGHAAGRLIEQAGLKGRAVGSARISERHANVIVAGPGACASDVLALIELTRRAVRDRTGINLELEVALLE